MLAAALAVSTGGVVAAAAGPPPGAPPADAKVREPGVDRGPGFAPPVDRPAKGLAENEAKAAALARSQSGPRGSVKEEVTSKRTAASRTVRDSVTGVLTTEVFSEAVHYQDAKGAWAPIDNTLAAAPGGEGGWANKANRFTATFPADLTDGAVRVAETAVPERFVALKLDPETEAASTPAPAGPSETLTGPSATTPAPTDEPTRDEPTRDEPTETPADDSAADATGPAVVPVAAAPKPAGDTAAPAPPAADPEVDGAVVEYPDAAGPGADVAYEVLGDGVKETVTLETAGALGADAAVSFTVRTGKGLSPVLAGDVVTVVDARGVPVFMVPAPFMDDAAGAHSEDVAVALVPAGEGAHTLTLTPDPAWLEAEERVFPVVVDPTVTLPSPTLGCSISSTAATTSSCGAARLPVSWDTTGAQQRVLVRFDELLDVVPADALVERAELGLWPESSSTGVATSVDVKELTAGFATGATWNTRNGTTAWGTAGGDRAGLVSARRTLTPNGTYQSLQVGELVSRWVEGTSPHHGRDRRAAAAPRADLGHGPEAERGLAEPHRDPQGQHRGGHRERHRPHQHHRQPGHRQRRGDHV